MALHSHLEVIIGLLIGLIPMLGKPGVRNQAVGQPGGQNTHLVSLPPQVGMTFGTQKQLQ